ncbi:CHASE2 domain-containing sensor protein [Paenarthrobacter nicotinovorans]|uniref:chemotaxis protein n=1 Tax=Paenarthrobacter nicotinovorans TaxID=29320 RepID=UPI002788E415|nr:chemotaxis protein [Paenarthrobacter nicotinovorans]MDP9936841.1 CHASE2 domain-containing sensor protein [Paenarthrobacter nicotinovorans]
MAVVLIFLATFAAVALGGWVLYALTHPVAAGQGILIFLCKAAGIIALVTAVVAWLGQGLLQAVPPALFMAVFFVAANRLERRWRRW